MRLFFYFDEHSISRRLAGDEQEDVSPGDRRDSKLEVRRGILDAGVRRNCGVSLVGHEHAYVGLRSRRIAGQRRAGIDEACVSNASDSVLTGIAFDAWAAGDRFTRVIAR